MDEVWNSDPDESSLVRVSLLGGFRIERNGDEQAEPDWPRRSAKTLTKLLAAHRVHALHREQIIDILWPEVDAESALNSFGKALHAARRALEPGLERRRDSSYLRLTDSVLALNTRRIVIDADVFESLAGDAMRSGEVSAYQAALAAYCGELLPEDRYEPWCAERRSALAELHAGCSSGSPRSTSGAEHATRQPIGSARPSGKIRPGRPRTGSLCGCTHGWVQQISQSGSSTFAEECSAVNLTWRRRLRR